LEADFSYETDSEKKAAKRSVHPSVSDIFEKNVLVIVQKARYIR
jgi:hypothetical protein